MKKSGKSFVIGVDEVGRGPLAGPVYVAAVALPKEMRVENVCFSHVDKFPSLHNSKALTQHTREIWDKEIKFQEKQRNLYISYARVSPGQIDKENISYATNRAVYSAVSRLIKKHNIKSASLVLDGGLSCKNKRNELASLGVHSIFSIVKGDELHPVISLASITAKVKRDGVMRKLHKEFPVYGFDEHKGYGTAKHIRAIGKYGLSPHHRVTFCSHFIKKKRIIDK